MFQVQKAFMIKFLKKLLEINCYQQLKTSFPLSTIDFNQTVIENYQKIMKRMHLFSTDIVKSSYLWFFSQKETQQQIFINENLSISLILLYHFLSHKFPIHTRKILNLFDALWTILLWKRKKNLTKLFLQFNFLFQWKIIVWKTVWNYSQNNNSICLFHSCFQRFTTNNNWNWNSLSKATTITSTFLSCFIVIYLQPSHTSTSK